ncbi:MAG: cyclic nucleotide-binding domain-containing protein [Candidatus Riflebacteria bacterium]|nr:cyclic nucleotide-binding domain-containing protein [Candidatus Riflebacteria bacterium]
MPDDSDLEEKLMQVAFSEIRETSPEIFAKLGRTLRDGEHLFREGDRSTELVMIVSGLCKITKKIGEEEKVLVTLKPGEILGEMSHFDDAPRSATATAVGTLNVLWLSRDNFGMIFELHHKWTLHLIQQLANRIHGTFQRMVAAHDRPPPAPAVQPKPTPVVQPKPAPAAQPKPAPTALPKSVPESPAVPPPPGMTVDRLERFLSDVRGAVQRGAAMAGLKQQALARLATLPEQKRKIEELFAWAEKVLRVEGLIR